MNNMNFMKLYIPPKHDPLEQLDKHGLCESERRLASNTDDDQFYKRYIRKNPNNDKI